MSGPISLANPVRFSAPLPQATDIVIIGGGVIGICAALYLIRAGKRVTLVEKGRIAGEQSSRNWGWIRQLGRDREELPVMVEASRLWQELDRDTGRRTGFRREGIFYLRNDDHGEAKHAAYLEDARACQVEVRQLTTEEIAARIDTGAGGRRWKGGLYCPSDARGEPWQAVPALAELAQSQGVVIRENCAARALEVTNRSVRGVHTEAGYVACAQVVVAAGAWSSLFLRRHDVSIPQLSVRSTAARTAPLPAVFEGCAADEEIAFRRREDGGYTMSAADAHDLYIGPDAFRHLIKYLPTARQSLGQTRFHPWAQQPGFPDGWTTSRHWAEDGETPFERCRVLDPAADAARTQKVRQRFAARFPGLGLPQITHAWAGMIDTMPDVVPIVDRVPQIAGLILATGMSGHGFGIGPGFGRCIANIALERPTGHDLTRFRFSRFTDGSPIRPGPGM
ncbi:MAG: FAD-binding oxidoreductase [Nitratireductor sp.]|nr:FAD-binding oxidoreductase [Nitratireductor sp.]